MADDIKIAVFENGELNIAHDGGKGNEVTLALPIDRLLIKIVKIPIDCEVDEGTYLEQQLSAISPYPDEPLHVASEIVRETESGRIVIAAALPESSADDIGEALDAKGFNVTRVDSYALGVLRVAWERLKISSDGTRRIVLLPGLSCTSLFVLDGDCPVVIRAISNGDDLKREAMLSLVEAESFGGYVPLKEIVFVDGVECSELEFLAPLIKIDLNGLDPIDGLIERSCDPQSFNLLPTSWREYLEETRFKSKLKLFGCIAALVWVAMLGVIIGVPKYYDYQASKQNKLINRNASKFNEVNEKKKQVEIVQGVSNHDRGALEVMRVVVTSMPEGVELSNWKYLHDKNNGLVVSFKCAGSGTRDLAYRFKENLDAIKLSQVSENVEDAEVRYFTEVNLSHVVEQTRGVSGNITFDIECKHAEAEGDD